ncbi:MAG: EAL domain-containing protein, partial [Lysobacter sp.]
MAMPGNENWVLLAIRVDQLPELAALGLSAMFELEEKVFARLLALLDSQDVSTIWMEFGFGILIRRDDWSQVESFARQLCSHVVEEPFQMPEIDVSLTISVGMALVPPADTPEGGHRWFAIAHAAQSIAYRHGGNQCEGVLTRAFEPMPPERVLIIREWLEEARTGGNVVVEFQPVLPLGADTPPMYTICAKLRDLRAPLGGVYLDEFRPLATGTGALTMIDRLSLFSAVEALEQERAHGRATELVVPIDLSTLDGVPWRWLEAELARHGAVSRGLVLELQASTALQEPLIVERFVRLRDLGARISLHDHNGGLESLRTWSALP